METIGKLELYVYILFSFVNTTINYLRLSSWSYSATIYPPDFTELLAQSNVGANAIKTIANSQYTTGHSGVLFGK